MKKFFTGMPLQVAGQLSAYHYQPVGNVKLEMEGEISFPILTAVNGYAHEGEEIRIIAMVTDNEAARHNCDIFEEAARALCRKKNISCPRGVERVMVPENMEVATHAATFQKLIEFADDHDELYACMTFGTKPMSMALMMAVQYAYRVQRDAHIECVVYGEVVRSGPDSSKWYGRVYDMTALLQLDEIVNMMAEQRIKNPRAILDTLLSL